MAASLRMSLRTQSPRLREEEMKQTYVFDVDGTLTPPRQPIEALFATFFLNFARSRSVVLVSGSDLPKLQQQLPEEILHPHERGVPGTSVLLQTPVGPRRDHYADGSASRSVQAGG